MWGARVRLNSATAAAAAGMWWHPQQRDSCAAAAVKAYRLQGLYVLLGMNPCACFHRGSEALTLRVLACTALVGSVVLS
jgi:hypothetical protein